MTYAEFASDLPPDRAIGFSSAEENEETMRRLGVNQEVRQVGKGKFRADLAVRSTEHVDLFADRFSTATSMVLEPPAGAVALLIFRSAGRRFLACGENVANDRLVFMPAGTSADLALPDLAGSEALTVPEARFTEMREALCPTLSSLRPDGTTVLRGDTARLHGLRNAVVDLLAHPETDPAGENASFLLAETIAWMGESSRRWRPQHFSVNGSRTRVAKRAQEFLEEHYWDSLPMADLCRVAGVGLRTLQRGFREHFGLTITDYLKVLRLNAARRELAAAEPGQLSVTTVAMRYGFAHLGRFSVGFREHFGETPRETLARGPGRTS